MLFWQSCLSPLSQLQREVKVLPRTPSNQSPSNFWAWSLNPAMLAILPLSCFLLPTSCSFPCATFYGFARKERRFFFPLFASLHYSHLFIQALSSFVFQSHVDLGSLFAEMLFWTRLVWEGGLVHRPPQGVGEMCLFKLIRIFSSRNANGGKAIKAACFLLSNLC